MLSADGRTLLPPPHSGVLLAPNDPDQLVPMLLRVPRARERAIRLGEVIENHGLERTVSYWRWMDRIVWQDGAWTLTRSDGSGLRIAANGPHQAQP